MFRIDSANAPDIVFAPGQRNPRLPADMRAFSERYDRNQKSGTVPEQRTFCGPPSWKKLPLASVRLRAETAVCSIIAANRHHIGVAMRAKAAGFDSSDPDMADYGKPWSATVPSIEDYNAFSSYERVKTPAMKRYYRFLNRREGADEGHSGPVVKEFGDRTINHETGLDVPLLKQFVASTPARPKAGPTKDAKMTHMPRRAALYNRYIEQGRWVCCGRIDVDTSWDEFDQMVGLLQDLYDADEIPLVPHASVSDKTADGSIRKPHLLVFLPVGDVVDRKQKRTVALLKAVLRGWIRKLREHGIAADPGGMSNAWRLKCPISPFMRTGILNQEMFLSLRDQAAFWRNNGISMAPFDVASGEWRDIDDDRSLVSNAAWPQIQRKVWNEIMPRERDADTERYRDFVVNGTKERMCAELMGEVIPWAESTFPTMDPRQRFLAVRAVCHQCAELWDDTKRARIVDRGVMTREGLIHPREEQEEKQRKAGIRTRAQQRNDSIARIAEGIRDLIAEGVVPQWKLHWRQIKARTGLGRTTIQKWWREADYAAQTAYDAMQAAGRPAPLEPVKSNALEFPAKLSSRIVVQESPRWSVGKKGGLFPAFLELLAEVEKADAGGGFDLLLQYVSFGPSVDN